VLAKGSEIDVVHLPREFLDVSVPEVVDESGQTILPENASLAEVEAFWIERAINACQGNKVLAAKKLGVAPSTLYRKQQQNT
jgi:DNA-binding NtrC family response regulator